jgi:hypothetical protein
MLSTRASNFAKQSLKAEFVQGAVVLIIATSSMLLSVYQSLPGNGPYSHDDWIKAIASGAGVSIFVFLITDKFATMFNDWRVRSHIDLRIDDVVNRIATKDTIACLGSPEEAISRIVASISEAHQVWNILASYGNAKVFEYSDEKKAMVVQSLQMLLEKGGARWFDIVSHPDDIKERMRAVFKKRGPRRENYYCFKLKNEWPVLNFIVMEFLGGRDKEVYFGFGRHPNDTRGEVFFSTNEKLVETFRRLHMTLSDRQISEPYRLEID